MSNTNQLPVLRAGTRVYLPDSTIGYAYHEGGGRYTVRQGRRVDTGWLREQLTILL